MTKKMASVELWESMVEIKHPKLWYTIKQNLPKIQNTILKKEGLLGASISELTGGYSNLVFLA